MRFVEAGGARVSVIGLGTWQFGSREWGYGESYARDVAGDIVRKALDLGVNLIDTAEIYALGRSETILGRAIADRRDQVFLATKLLPILPVPAVAVWRAAGSLRRLGVDAIDLYQLHWPNPVVPLGTTMAGFRRLLDRGLVRHVGVSNYSLERWHAAERTLGGPVLSNQVQFSLAVAGPLQGLVPYAQQAGRLVIAYSPLGQGLLSGRYDATHRPAGTVRRNNKLFSARNLERASDLLAALREIAERLGATPAQVSLAWLIRRPNVVAIPGASSVEQVEANVAAVDLELTEEDDRRLTETALAFSPPAGLAALPDLIAARRRR